MLEREKVRGELCDQGVNRDVQRKLEALRSDFTAVSGRPFDHFFCPLLLEDNPSKICRGHLVNQAFPNTNRRWTVQRRDVESFYGTFVEAEFVELKEHSSPIATTIEKGLIGKLRPEITYLGRRVEYYKPTATVPPQHSEVLLNPPLVAFGSH